MNVKKNSWIDFKNIVNSKSLRMQYEDSNSHYFLYAVDEIYEYTYVLKKDSGLDQQDFEINYKSNCNQRMSPDTVYEDGKQKLQVKATIGAVGVGEIFGWDLFPTGWIILSGSITVGDWIKIIIDGYENQYTIQEGDTWEDIINGLVTLINNNENINSKVDAFNHYKQIFIRAEEPGDTFEGLSLNTLVSSGATITATRNATTLTFLWKKILVEEDINDRRFGRIGVFGEVGSRTKAENPIHISVRKSIATSNEIVFVDKDIPINKIWYITNVAVADDIATEFKVYYGIQRDKVEYFSGNGSNKDFILSYVSVNNSNFILVKVNGSPLILNSDYWIYFDSNDETKSYINFKTAPPFGTNNIEVTYDAVKMVLGLFVQASSSQVFEFGAPIKLYSTNFIIASVSNKSANAGVALLNLNGFYEEEI